ncbi:hypothetical protein [Pararhizobium sp. BT-229]
MRAVALFLELLREKRNRGSRPKPPVEIERIWDSIPQRINDKAFAS